ncbi:MAG: GNAT family N-acetyltransferase [Alistipes senegalensis]|nr:GNAT family N-acetyltransferase [Oxalobacter formigenes]MCM1281721.1 GNAT family N-acetyltransferase [Alistipes senegalensis]
MAELFHDTVHAVNAQDYTKEQLNAWAPANMNLEKWDKSLLEQYSIVAESGGIIQGFGSIDIGKAYLDRLFVHKNYQGQGIATAICEHLEGVVEGKITAHVSVTAKSFFEMRGYKVFRKQYIERQGIVLANFIMENER